jgi:tRNA G10  N-methylase Trm11
VPCRLQGTDEHGHHFQTGLIRYHDILSELQTLQRQKPTHPLLTRKNTAKMEIDKIYNMDCLEGMTHIPDGSIDAIICDLPYGTTANKWDSIIPLDQLWQQYKRIIKKGGPIVLFAQQPFASVLGCRISLGSSTNGFGRRTIARASCTPTKCR